MKQIETLNDEELDSDSEFDENDASGEGNLKFNHLLMVNSSVSEETIFKFKEMVKRDNVRSNRIMILLLTLLYFMSTLIMITVREIINKASLLFILRGIFCCLLAVAFVVYPLGFS